MELARTANPLPNFFRQFIDGHYRQPLRMIASLLYDYFCTLESKAKQINVLGQIRFQVAKGRKGRSSISRTHKMDCKK